MQIEIPILLDKELDLEIEKHVIKNKEELVLDILLSVIRQDLVKHRNYKKRDGILSGSEAISFQKRIDGLNHLRKKSRKKMSPTPISF